MRELLGYVALAFVLFWIVTDPAGAANTVAYVGHALGVAATSLTHHLSTQKPALTGRGVTSRSRAGGTMTDMRKIAIRLRGGAHARTGVLMDAVRENPLLAVVAGIGFSVSFQTIAKLAVDHHVPGPPILYPLGIDAGILALIAESLLLIRQGRSDFIPRVLAWALTGVTIYINANGAAPGDRVGEGLHVVMPALWVTCLELVRHRKVTATRSDGIPSGRWVAAPWPTLTLWRRMRRDGITSYPLALELEQARWFARDLIRATPAQYRPSRSSLVCKRIRSGKLREDVRKAVAASLDSEWAAGWEGAVTEWVTDALGLTERLAGSLENARRDMTRAALEATPEPMPEPAPETTPEATPEVVPEPAPRARPKRAPKRAPEHAPKVALKLTAARSRSMPPEQVAEHVSAMLEEHGDVSLNRVKTDLSVGTDKAKSALEIAKRERAAHVVVPMERRA